MFAFSLCRLLKHWRVVQQLLSGHALALADDTYMYLMSEADRRHHWRPNLPGGCCICLEQSAGVSTRIAVTASFSQQTEDRAFCPVVQLFWLRASHCTDYHVTSTLFLRVTCPCSLRTYATLKFIRSSSSSSASLVTRICIVPRMGLTGTLKSRYLTSRDHHNCEDWHHETGQRETK